MYTLRNFETGPFEQTPSPPKLKMGPRVRVNLSILKLFRARAPILEGVCLKFLTYTYQGLLSGESNRRRNTLQMVLIVREYHPPKMPETLGFRNYLVICPEWWKTPNKMKGFSVGFPGGRPHRKGQRTETARPLLGGGDFGEGERKTWENFTSLMGNPFWRLSGRLCVIYVFSF